MNIPSIRSPEMLASPIVARRSVAVMRAIPVCVAAEIGI